MADEGDIAPMELPTTEFGVRCFQISEKQYLNPTGLFEMMSRDPEIQRAGVFIGRLKESADTIEADEGSVELVKDLLRRDPADKEAGGKVFRPEVVSVRDLWAEKNVLEIIGCSPADRRKKQYSKLKEEFGEQILGHNFSQAPATELELALSSGGVDACLNTLFEILRDRERKLLYAPNTCANEFLQTTASCAMKDMRTNIENLPGGPHLGINLPSIYIGDEASTFNLHIEDHSLESVNRHVAGKAKVWFFVPPRYNQSLYNVVRDMGISAEDRVCNVFLQHRHIFIDPRTVLHEGIPVTTVVQKPGDVVYVLPNAHHWGFNIGKNINEAINCGSRAWVLPGLISTGRCHCSSVAGNYYCFELEQVFRALVETEEFMEHYQRGRLQIFSDLLRRNMAALHPQTARPFQDPLKPSHLLGPQFSDMEIGKPWIAPLKYNYSQNSNFWGGCELVELEDDTDKIGSEEKEKMDQIEEGGDVEEGEQEEEADEREEEEKEELQGKTIGENHCTVDTCTWSTKEKGNRGMKAAERHVKACHANNAPEVFNLLKLKYDAGLRRFKTSHHFECHVYGKTKRGTDAHEQRHLKSCMARHAKLKFKKEKAEDR